MNKSPICWHTFLRDAIPEALFGGKHASRLGRLSIEPDELADSKVAVGYVDSRSDAEYNPPCLLVLGDSAAAETLSWLKVYAPETSPLSQYARVVSAGDWSRFANVDTSKREAREDIWASVVLGEALAQGEVGVEIGTLPLAWASACFSMAIARAKCFYGTDEATRTCADRLRQVEADRRFVRRAVSINDLLPIWAMAGGHFGEPVSIGSTVELVLDAAFKYMSKGPPSTSGSVPNSFRDLPGFTSDSIEERVLAFHRLTSDLANNEVLGKRNDFSSVLVAAAAFLVGRSTTHEFLLRRVSKQFPVASVWYGLIAALAGPVAWDINWSRALKSVERQIRPRFNWSESSGFDLCWVEYQWMASAFDGAEIFGSLPKLMPRVLSIEIIPGSTCQFRLATSPTADAESRPSTNGARERELQSTLAQFVNLANHARHLLEGASGPSAQQSLELEGGEPSRARGSRTKKSKR